MQPQQSLANGPQVAGPQGSAALAPQVPQQQQQVDGQQTATVLQELERMLDQANVYALENGQPVVARLTEDLEELIETQRKLILRQSPFAESFRQAVATTLQQGSQQLQQQPNDGALQEVVAKIQQASAALQSGSLQPQSPQQPQQPPAQTGPQN
ncbi:hypothetical protein ACFQRB_18920 [Halobaculum litoreum]|uniref:Uncharacterized protein n=1 Tax=Halobaculum litoreum TaxID=3031998 RepID=A0ABD5XS70_9EURY